eukprot:scaffold11489_cov78-Skeletonema_marinoi.AAC.5
MYIDGVEADYIYLLRNHTNTSFFLTSLNLNLDLNVDVFGTWYRSTLSHLRCSFEVWLQLLQQVRRCQLGLGNVVSDSDEPGPGPGELSSHLGESSGDVQFC